MSIHPDHYFPNAAPKGYHMIDSRGYKLISSDICWHMDDDKWHPIDREDIGKDDTNYIRLARLDSEFITNRANRDKKIKWQPMKTCNEHVCLLQVNGKAVLGYKLSIGPKYEKTGWYLCKVMGYPTRKRVYPTGWTDYEPYK